MYLNYIYKHLLVSDVVFSGSFVVFFIFIFVFVICFLFSDFCGCIYRLSSDLTYLIILLLSFTIL